jgi:hypothetical protein
MASSEPRSVFSDPAPALVTMAGAAAGLIAFSLIAAALIAVVFCWPEVIAAAGVAIAVGVALQLDWRA